MHAEQGLDVVRLNPGFVYGPGALLRSAFVEQARKGRLRCIGNGSNRWSCVHVDDQGRAYAAPWSARARRLLRRRRLLPHPPA
jgi:nucleoside-diphosphate-sugar epimerase